MGKNFVMTGRRSSGLRLSSPGLVLLLLVALVLGCCSSVVRATDYGDAGDGGGGGGGEDGDRAASNIVYVRARKGVDVSAEQTHGEQLKVRKIFENKKSKRKETIVFVCVCFLFTKNKYENMRKFITNS